jgi:hypothetical protein
MAAGKVWSKGAAVSSQKFQTAGHLSVGGTHWRNSNFEPQGIQIAALKPTISKPLSVARFPLKNQTEKLN